MDSRFWTNYIKVFNLRAEHNFAQKHVFERRDGSGTVDGVVTFKGLKEVGVGRLPVLLLRCMDDPCSRYDTLALTAEASRINHRKM